MLKDSVKLTKNTYYVSLKHFVPFNAQTHLSASKINFREEHYAKYMHCITYSFFLLLFFNIECMFEYINISKLVKGNLIELCHLC